MRQLIVGSIIVLGFSVVGAGEAPEKLSDIDACLHQGENWSVLVSAPDRWVVECRGVDSDDVDVALYPEYSTWAESPFVMYLKSFAISPGESFEQFVTNAGARFKAGQPTVSITDAPALVTLDKKRVVVREFTGDQWGNHEAVGYIDGGAVHLIVVMSSRSEEVFKESRGSFDAFVSELFFANVVIKK